MKEPLRIGIIGIGFMGSTHFQIYDGLPQSRVAAVADVDAVKLSGDWSGIVGNIGDMDYTKPVDLSGITCYGDGFDLIADPTIDVVDICVPTFLHKRYAIAALEAGKHVFCEKPIGRNFDEAKEITEAAQKSGKHFSNGLCVRAWPEYRHAWNLYHSGRLGKLVSASFKRVSPSIHGNSWEDWFMHEERSGGALLDLHLHDTDEVRYFFGRPKAVTSFGLTGHRSDTGIDHVFTNYDFGDGTLVMSQGAWDAAKAVPFEMSFLIVCERGTIRLSESGYGIYYEDGSVETPAPALPELPTGWHVELDVFTRSILENTSPDTFLTLEQMRDSMAIIRAEEISVREMRTVEVIYE